jgi:hypothetical protein
MNGEDVNTDERATCLQEILTDADNENMRSCYLTMMMMSLIQQHQNKKMIVITMTMMRFRVHY